jgi:alpha-mannosidase
MPHVGSWQQAGVVAEAAAFNMPLLVTQRRAPVAGSSFIEVTEEDGSRNLVLDTVKRAEDSDDTVLRFYECHGARGVAQVRITGSAFKRAVLCNLLEDEAETLPVHGGTITLEYRPWQIISVKVRC